MKTFFKNNCDILKKISGLFNSLIVVIIVISVFWGGYFAFFYMAGHPIEEKNVIIEIVNSKNKSAISQNKKQLSELSDILKQIKKQQAKRSQQIQQYKRESYLTVSTLNAFYASLFTAIAVLITIVGLFAWKKISELSEKLTKLRKIEEKVNFLHQKKDDAAWVKNKFDENELNIASSKLNLNKEEKRRFIEMQKHLLSDITDNSWLEIILAKKFLEGKEYGKAFKLYDFIQKRDLLDSNSKIESVLYHLLGQLYTDYYFQNIKGQKDDKINKINDENEQITIKEHLNICIEYYKRSLKMRKEQQVANDETLGNLAVVLIEASKLESNSNEQATTIDQAISYLKEIINQNKATYNTYYDFARATYLKGKTDDVVNYLVKSAEKVNSIKGKEHFYEFLDNEDILNNIQDFEKVKSRLKSIIDGKKWLKSTTTFIKRGLNSAYKAVLSKTQRALLK